MKKKLQLPLQTSNFVVGFMIWVIISSLMPYISEDIPIDSTQQAWVTAIPVILGSVLRIPLGTLANRFGARIIFIFSFIILLFPVFYLSMATTVTDLVIGGVFVGVGGAVFSIGVTSLPKYYPKDRQGLVNGIYGMGNAGTAITTFASPVVAEQIGWQSTIQLYLILLGIFIVATFFLGDKDEQKVKTSMSSQIKAIYRDEKLWLFSLLYFITFGSFVAFTVFLPSFLVNNFGLDNVDAGMRTAGFIVLATFLRPVGGLLADRLPATYLLMAVFFIITIGALPLAFEPSLLLFTIGCLAIAASGGIGSGIIFKLVPSYFAQQVGMANGVVSMMGGLGGFFPPIMLTSIYTITGSYSVGFMALSQVGLASLILVIWFHFHGKLHLSKEVIDSTPLGVMITNKKGRIITVNPAFTELTGYDKEDVLGKNPNILQSGKQSDDFYANLWQHLHEKGEWQGEIWNRRKDGSLIAEWLTIHSIRDEAGEVIQYAGIFSDITDRKE